MVSARLPGKLSRGEQAISRDIEGYWATEGLARPSEVSQHQTISIGWTTRYLGNVALKLPMTICANAIAMSRYRSSPFI